MVKRKVEIPVEPDPRSIQELIAALAEADEDSPEYRGLYMALTRKPEGEVFAAASALCVTTRASDRALGASILPEKYPKTFNLLAERIQVEQEEGALAAVIFKMGHNHNRRAVKLLVPFRQHRHEDVRFAVACALGGFDDPTAIDALIRLSSDEDDDVRDWATFGLGSMIETDTPEIREALFARIGDPHYPTQLEAMLGLAHRKDARAIEPLLKDMAEGVNSMRCEALEEIFALIDPKHPLLAEAVEQCRKHKLAFHDE